MFQSFTAIVALWPSPDTMAVELGAKVETVRKWRQRDSIPADWWLAVVEGAKRRGETLTVNDMAELAARKRPEEASAA